MSAYITEETLRLQHACLYQIGLSNLVQKRQTKTKSKYKTTTKTVAGLRLTGLVIRPRTQTPRLVGCLLGRRYTKDTLSGSEKFVNGV